MKRTVITGIASLLFATQILTGSTALADHCPPRIYLDQRKVGSPIDDVQDADYVVVEESAKTSSATTATQPKSLSSADLYNLLARQRPLNFNVQALFGNASVNEPVRIELNQKIGDNEYLSNIAIVGNDFRKNLTEFFTNRLTNEVLTLDQALFPWKKLYRDYDLFKKQQRNWDEKPMKQADAERMARQETATRFNMPETFGGSELTGNPMIKDYYSRRIQAYTNTDVRQIAQKEKIKEDLLRGWISKEIESLKQKRVYNTLAALKTMSELDGENFEFFFHRKEGGSYFTSSFKVSISELMAANATLNAPLKSVGLVDLYISNGNALPGVKGKERRNALLLNTVQSTDVENIPKISEGQIPGIIYLTFSGERFEKAAKRFFKWRKIPSNSQFAFALPLERIYEVLKQFQNRLGKTDQNLSTQVSNEILLRYYYDFEYREAVGWFSRHLDRLRVQQFELDLKATANHESNRQAVGNLLEQSKQLLLPQPQDAVTGVEWSGYRVNYAFWSDRDYLAYRNLMNKGGSTKSTQKHWVNPEIAKVDKNFNVASYKQPESTRFAAVRKVKDSFYKARTWVRTAVVVGTMVASVALPYEAYQGIKALVSTVGGSSGSSGGSRSGSNPTEQKTSIGPDREAHDGENGKEGEKASVAYTVKSWVKSFHEDSVDTRSIPYGFRHNRFYIKPSTPSRNFTEANTLEVSEISKMRNIKNSLFKNHNAELEERNTPFKPFQSIYVSNQIDAYDYKGFVTIPVPEGGYQLTDLSINTLGSGAYGFDDRLVDAVLVHPQTGNILVKINNNYTDNRFEFHATFTKDIDAVAPAALQDPRFKNLDKGRLLKISEEIDKSDLGIFGSEFRKLLKVKDVIDLEDLARLIQETQLYSLRPGTKPKWVAAMMTKGEFGVYSRNVHEDTLRVKCDFANSLFRDIARYYYKDETDISIDLLFSSIYNNDGDFGDLSDELRGIMTTIGHARAAVRIKGKPGIYVLDATPTTQEDGVIIDPADHYSPKQRYKDLEAAKKKQAEDEEERRKNFKWPVDWVSGKRRDEIFAVVEVGTNEAGVTEASRIVKDQRHKQMVEALNADLKKVLWTEIKGKQYPNQAFQQTLGGRDMLQPQRMYILGKTLLRFSERELTLDETIAKMHDLYAQVGIEKPKNSQEMISMLEKIYTYESELWVKVAKLYTDKRKFQYSWADLPDLKSTMFNMMTVVKSYHWQSPEAEEAADE